MLELFDGPYNASISSFVACPEPTAAAPEVPPPVWDTPLKKSRSARSEDAAAADGADAVAAAVDAAVVAVVVVAATATGAPRKLPNSTESDFESVSGEAAKAVNTTQFLSFGKPNAAH
jgi:hypothetical protein